MNHGEVSSRADMLLPPIAVNAEGGLRRVGFEFEYAGLSLPDSAALVAELFGGKVVEKSLSHYIVDTQEFGKFSVKLDMTMMQKLSAEAAEKRSVGTESLETIAEPLLVPLVSSVMPNEIVTPPIPLDQLSAAEVLSGALREKGALGTAASPIYAFGLHLNPEMPNIPPERLRDYLAAFIVRQERLKEETNMDLTRQLTSFAGLFSVAYGRLLLAPEYQPSLAQLIDDYLEYNPTRNRALDMLPLFAHLDEARVRAKVDDARVRPRPTFHYRLPNCDLDNPRWSPLHEWEHWLEVERLAEDPERLRAESSAWLASHRSVLDTLFEV